MAAAPAILARSQRLPLTWADMGRIGRIYERRGKSGRTHYCIDFRPLGRIFTAPDPAGVRRMPITDRKDAERILESVRAAVGFGGLTLAQALSHWLPKVSPAMRFGARYQAWLETLRERVARGERAQSYLDELVRYVKPGGYLEPLRQLAIWEVRYGHLEDLDLALSRRGLAPKSRALVMQTLRTFLRWCARHGDISVVPATPVVTVPEHDPRVIEPEAQRRILDAIPEDRRGIFLALAFHGLRPSEACRLDLGDYDRKSGVIRMPSRSAKTKRSREIPVSEEMRDWLMVYAGVGPPASAHGRSIMPAVPRPEMQPARQLPSAKAPLFQNPRGRAKDRRWSVDSLEKLWHRARKAAGVPTVALYEGTKHSSATAARRRGVALEVIQAALGHADVRSTERYARLAELAPVAVLQGRKA